MIFFLRFFLVRFSPFFVVVVLFCFVFLLLSPDSFLVCPQIGNDGVLNPVSNSLEGKDAAVTEV